MLRILMLLIIVVFSKHFSIAQPKVLLGDISKKMMEYKSYRTTCNYTFTFPSGDSMSIESIITLKKELGDSICGYYYSFITNKNDIETFGDFAIYFGGYSYKSYKGIIDKTSNIGQFKFDKNNLELPAKRNVLLNQTAYQIAKNIDEYIIDTSYTILQKPDTLIDNKYCYQFKITKSKFIDNSLYINTTDLCFDKTELYPTFQRKSVSGILINQARFIDTEINLDLPLYYFSEENLLPKNWQNISKNKKIIDPKDMEGKKAPNWNLPIIGHNINLSLSELKGKYVLVEFTATWCGVCNIAAEDMNRIEERLGNNPNLEIVNIFSSERDNIKSISSFAEKHKIKSIILYNAEEVEKKYHIYGYPNYFLISPKGIVLKVLPGYMKGVDEYLINSINEYLK
ncbi:MAG: peroxiredoxin family protein [Tenuifilaceae bacterium]